MKKIVLALAAIAMVALFTTSCNKKCTCKTYAGGLVVYTQEDIEIESGKKCADMGTIFSDENGNNKTGIQCKTSW